MTHGIPLLAGRIKTRKFGDFLKPMIVRDDHWVLATIQRRWMMGKDELITAEYIRSILNYDLTSGLLEWKFSNKHNDRFGKTAGGDDGIGYTRIKIRGRQYKAHILIWLIVTGSWPKEFIDHIDCNKKNNKIENLREADRSQNGANATKRTDNTSGFKGVSKEQGNWVASIKTNGRKIRLGTFGSAELAHSVYLAAANRYFGEFARSI
jgi:hypothetical protein